MAKKKDEKYCIFLRNMRIYYTYSLPSSSVVECLTVNQRVAGSSPARVIILADVAELADALDLGSSA